MPYLGNVPSSFNVGTNNIDNDAITTEKIAAGAVVNADVNAAAAIAGTKISPDFGSQNILTTGTSTAASFSPSSSSVPTNGFYLPSANNVAISTNGSERIKINSTGELLVGTSLTSIDGNWAVQANVSASGVRGVGINNNGGYGVYLTYDNTARYSGGACLRNVANSLLAFETNNTERFRVRADGTFEIKGGGTAGVTPAVSVNPSASANSLVIDSSGRVGLGTSSPGATCEIYSSSTRRARVGETPLYTPTDFVTLGGSLTISRPFDNRTDVHAFYAYDTASGALNNLAITSRDNIVFLANGAERVRIDSSGRVGIGTTSPGSALDVVGNARVSGAYSWSDYANTIYHGITAPAADVIAFRGGGSERARIDSSGRLLVGTSSARSNWFNTSYTPQLQLEGISGAGSTISICANTNDNGGSYLVLGKTRGTTVGANTVVASDDSLGQVVFQGSDGTELVTAATITGLVDGTPGANDMPGRLVFSTTADGASSPTERMRINNAGNMLVGRTGTDGAALIQAPASSTIPSYGSATGVSTAITHFEFRNSNGLVGTISTNASATAYNTSSDYRLKENVIAVTDGITRLQQLKPSRFNFIADPDHTVDGFIAHEAQAIVPECVTGDKDAVDHDGNPVYQGIDQSKLVPLLTAALQEAIAEIASLKDRVAALEAS
jgi:hypothetical protein